MTSKPVEDKAQLAEQAAEAWLVLYSQANDKDRKWMLHRLLISSGMLLTTKRLAEWRDQMRAGVK